MKHRDNHEPQIDPAEQRRFRVVDYATPSTQHVLASHYPELPRLALVQSQPETTPEPAPVEQIEAVVPSVASVAGSLLHSGLDIADIRETINGLTAA